MSSRRSTGLSPTKRRATEGDVIEKQVRLGDVETWYAEHGAGDPAVVLRPGGAGTQTWGSHPQPIAEHFRVYTPERRGHGRTPDVEGPMTYELMVQDTVAFLEVVVGGPAHMVGCSAGAIVALMAAVARPDLVRRLALVSGVHHRDGWHPEAIDPDTPPHPVLRRGYEELSPDGAEHYPVVHRKLARLNFEEPTLRPEDLSRVVSRTLVMVGDDDEVSLEHAIATYRAIRDAELAVVPRTSHGLLHEKPGLCNAILLDFLVNDPIQTIAPVRRRRDVVEQQT
jgi:pimeloyl-ACP methyl ester carboxylesterase